MMNKLFYLVIVLLVIAAAASFYNTMIDTILFTFLVFIGIVASILYWDRKKVKLEGIIIIRRSQRGIRFINAVTKKFPRFWNIYGTIGVIVTFPLMIFVSVLLVWEAVKLVIMPSVLGGGVRLLLPAPVSSPTLFPGVFVLPWWIWIIGVAFVIVPHEFSHGIMCRLRNVRIKSVGWILLILLPGAFVEQDEKQLNKKDRMTKLKVYAAGSFANMTMAAFILLIFIIATNVIPSEPQNTVFSLDPEGPVALANLSGAIIKIDNSVINSFEDLNATMRKFAPNQTVAVTALDINYIIPRLKFPVSTYFVVGNNEQTYEVRLGEHPDIPGRAYLGVGPSLDAIKSDSFFWSLFDGRSGIIFWLFIFSFGIGLINLLPAKPLDGGLYFEEILSKFTKRSAAIAKYTAYALFMVLLFNIAGPVFL